MRRRRARRRAARCHPVFVPHRAAQARGRLGSDSGTHRETPHFQRIAVRAIIPLFDRRGVTRCIVQPDTGTAAPPGGTR
ncbi:hypothetical protein BDSB_17860 [Burkholderia dolosa PC543]|nr:hypothetical protein BDSB_17860 [Burkholderia dolosa PC543]